MKTILSRGTNEDKIRWISGLVKVIDENPEQIANGNIGDMIIEMLEEYQEILKGGK